MDLELPSRSLFDDFFYVPWCVAMGLLAMSTDLCKVLLGAGITLLAGTIAYFAKKTYEDFAGRKKRRDDRTDKETDKL